MKKPLNLAERYETAYFLLMNMEDKDMQTRIKAAKENPDKRDDRVSDFVKKVIQAGESSE